MTEALYHLGIKAIIKNHEGKILLLQVNPSALRGYSGEPYWDIPGGRVQAGDNVEETLRRELLEETGINDVRSITPFSMVLSNIRIPTDAGSVGLILSSYVCEIAGMPEITLSSEHQKASWFSPEEAAELLKVKYPAEFIEKIKEV